MNFKAVVFREFTPESLRRIEHYRKEEAERIAAEQLEQQKPHEDDNDERRRMIKPSNEESAVPKPAPNKELAVGETLPLYLQHRFPPELIGKPIEEIDPYYRTDDAFMVINKNHVIFRFSTTSACYIFSPFNCFRRIAIRILTHPLFSTMVMITILTNCVFMTLKNAPEINEYIFTILYTTEALTKCIARGFILEKYTFLRDAWNWLDFIVIVLAYITFFINLGKVAVLRTFRVLRALKTVAVVPGLKTIVNALIQSFIALRDVGVLSSFILSIFALIGLQLYMGALRQKCVPTFESFLNNSNVSSARINMTYEGYLKEIDNETYWHKENDLYVLCGNASGSIQCPSGFVCWKDRGMSPDFGYTSFDNYGWSMLACFRLMTQDYWENLYLLVLSAAGRFHFFYFVAVIFFGSFYLVNLILAIVSMSYQEQQKQVEAENEERARRKLEDELAIQKEDAENAAEARAHAHSHCDKNALTFQGINPDIEFKQKGEKNVSYNVQTAEGSPVRLDQSTGVPPNPTTVSILDETKQHSANEDIKTQHNQNEHDLTMTAHQSKSPMDYALVNEELTAEEIERISIRSDEVESIHKDEGAIIKFLRIYCCECSCPSPIFRKFQAIVAFFVLDAFVDLFITICIILNTLFMALDHHGQSETMARVLTGGNYFFTTIFTAECVLKIIAMSPSKFFKNGWNAFDFVIVSVSLIELGLANVKGLSVLRSFRLLRVFKLAKSWQTLNRLMSIIGKSIGALGNLTVVLIIIIFIFAVVGMQLFGQKYEEKFGKDMPRWNFFDFFHAFMIVFRVLCGEWIESMWVCLECAGWPCIPFFLLTFIIGNLVILNLFLALLLASFGSNVLTEKEEEENKIVEAIDRIQRFCRFLKQYIIYHLFCQYKPRRKQTLIENCVDDTVADDQSLSVARDAVSYLPVPTSSQFEQSTTSVYITSDPLTAGEEIEMEPMNTDFIPPPPPSWEVVHLPPDCFSNAITKYFACCAKCIPQRMQKRWTYLRSAAHWVVEHRYFEWVIIISILTSSTTLALEDIHTRKQPTFTEVLDIFDKVFTVVFTMELVLKWFAYGITNYFTSGWNWLDFVIVVVSVLGAALDLFGVADIPAFKSMRTLRALRPLKALSRFEGIRVVVNALFGAIPAIFNVLLVCLVFWLIFSIMGVQLFGGRFYKCVYVDTHDRVSLSENVTNRNDCLRKNFTWENSRVNYDNVLSGYLALFQVLGANGSLEMFMTEDQKKYYNAMKKMGNKKPTKALPRPRFALGRFLFDVTTSQKFDIFIMICIFLNMLCMCLEHYNQSEHFDRVLGYINHFFVAVFTIECVMKLVALNFKYFTIPWNVFDFVIVIASILGQTLGELMAKFFVNPTLLRVVRVARVGRILRLVKGAKGIRTLLFALAVSMPALFNIGLLLFLVMFIYSIFGMSFFGYVRKSAGLTDLFNFETFPNSMIVLFQMCTTAGWSGVYQGLTNDQPPDCDPTLSTPSNKGDCGDTSIATPFLVTYVIITSLVVVNMYIAVILENFSQAQEDVQQGLTDDDYDMYYEKWQRLDPSGSQFIQYEQLSDFVDGLEPPLRIPKPNHFALTGLDLPICENDRMHCVDILDGLTKYFLGAFDAEVPNGDADAPIDIKKDRPKDYHPVTTTVKRQRETYLGRIGLRHFRLNVERRRNERNNQEQTPEKNTIDTHVESGAVNTSTISI
ncbi:unnamed protein product [Rotaria socialis]|uniref:Sodium channel protein n=2 Tax=Rotaria socialis TaxID=392032 RepID=A0A820Y0L1_9BILA|nr:unnamed protein product [Rotaria socialis]CAF4539138.1 unnamed protein product [Rotaria socialis]